MIVGASMGDRSLALGWAVAVAFVAPAAMAQTAEFKCAQPGTVVEFSDGTRTTWQGPEGNHCKVLTKQPSGDERLTNWYAPTLAVPANRSQAFADQVKPWTLWPLSVGKKITGRFDGEGTTGPGSWSETITVDSYEKLTTRAGTFDVFLVTHQEEAISHKYRSTLRQWYAPALGVAVKFTAKLREVISKGGFTRIRRATEKLSHVV
jgi:hypothetical protein